jgi:hypothetical protein
VIRSEDGLSARNGRSGQNPIVAETIPKIRPKQGFIAQQHLHVSNYKIDSLSKSRNAIDGVRAQFVASSREQLTHNLQARLSASSAADLKFLQRLLQTRSGTSNRKAALES